MFSPKALALALVLLPGLASADAGDWLIRARVIDIAPDVSTSDTLSVLRVDVDDQVVPELDFTYFVTENLAAELILATAKHDVSSSLGQLGTVKHLPPTLTLQYHFAPDAAVRPYIGAGVNYTRFYDVDLAAGAAEIDVDRDSWGWALQVGVDIPVSKDWFVNLDVKKIAIETDASLDGVGDIGTLEIDPYVYGIGVGMRF